MKKSSFILILMSVLCAVSVFGATVNVSSCTQDLNVADNIYTLNQSINTSGVTNCLNITAANVTLNCMGFLINSTDATGVGIFLNNSDNSTIRNCVIDLYNISILTQSSTGVLIVNNTLTRANTSGIATIGLSDSILVNNTITNISGTLFNSYGILFTDGSSNNTVRNNNISDNFGVAGNISYGIMFWNSSTDNIIVNNYLMKNEWGMADLVGGNNFTGNLIRNGTGGAGSAAMLARNGAAGNIYVNNQLYLNPGDAFNFTDSGDHTVLNNNCSNNTGRGFLMRNSTNNIVSNNLFNGNAAGVRLFAVSSDNSFINNTASNNSLHGFWLEALSNRNSFIDNTAIGNNQTNGSGFFLDNVNENNFTGNTADYNSVGYTLNASCLNNTFRNNIATNNTWFGLDIVDATSPLNTFIGNSYYQPAAAAWDIRGNSVNCSFNNEVVGYLLFPTTCSFNKYNGTFLLSGLQNPPTDNQSADIFNTSLYVNLTNPTGWMTFNISYTAADIAGLRADLLVMRRYNDTDWVLTNGTSARRTAKNFVFANLTDFGAFGLFTRPQQPSRIIGGGGSGGGGGPFQATVTQDAPETGPETVPATPEQNQQYAPSSDLDTRGAESDTDAYASRDDLRNLRSDKLGGEVSAGMSTSSIVGLVLAILVIGGAAAYLLLNSKKKAGMRKNKRYKK